MYKRLLKIILTLLIFISLFAFIRHIDIKAVIDEVHHIGWKLLWIIVITASAYLFGTIGWQSCFIQKPKDVSLWKFFCIRHIGETISLFNPTSIIGGDYIKTVLLKPAEMSKQDILNSVLISRVLAVISQFSLVGISGFYFLLSSFRKNIPDQFQIVLWALAIVCCSTPILFFYILKQARRFKEDSALSYQVFRKLSIRLQVVMNAVIEFYQDHANKCYRAYFYFCLHWIIGSIELFFILYFSGITVSIFLSVFMDMSIVIIKSFGAFIPGQIGVEEFGNKILLTSIGIYTVNIWIVIALIRRSRQLFWIAFGFFAYLIIKKHYSTSYHGDIIRQS
ncbi:lysylphosphatidylglycerol synthase domain-containing protein [Sphingobacterium sp. SRCM116780]|uniref:lysylphosphatidylglycerol synthase domain-containing protein n=1 Tax=Sphingobacterium sp. SRCM116780 TaxID=2907623 RepID=UPI001F196CCA|nr:lysylphosphatidylglycerol synthase domain-containing protein [Sphingobacterium sp. SRCM116780]UIR55357.1 lysylphosphatidylglycerol synthase domain-containing protein [Sphingobacterium sp. SRCM116780]